MAVTRLWRAADGVASVGSRYPYSDWALWRRCSGIDGKCNRPVAIGIGNGPVARIMDGMWQV